MSDWSDEFGDYGDEDDEGVEWAEDVLAAQDALAAGLGRPLSARERAGVQERVNELYGFAPERSYAEQLADAEAAEEERLDQEAQAEDAETVEWSSVLAAQLEGLERQQGRKLTNREVDGICDQFEEVQPDGIGLEDVEAAFRTHWKDQGREPPDMGNQSDRREFMVELVADREAPAYEKALADLDHGKREERQEWMARRMAGESEEEAEPAEEPAA